MPTIRLLMLLSLTLAMGDVCYAQRGEEGDRGSEERGRDDRGRGDRGRGDRGRDERGRDDRGRGDRGRDERDGDSGGYDRDRERRRAEFMNGLDKNKDGIIDYDEVGERERWIMGRIVEGDFQPGMKVSIEDSLKRVRGEAVSPVPLDMRFGSTAPATAKPEGFTVEPSSDYRSSSSESRSSDRGSSRSSDGDDKSAEAARAMMEKYDENKNGILERDEWRRIGGEPEKADYDRNGVITAEEMRRRLAYRYSDQYERDQQRKTTSGAKPKEGDRKSWRFTSAHERLPEGLPSWFKDRDADLDGQVAMHEYASSWSESKANEFSRYDRNGDGIITPDEVAK